MKYRISSEFLFQLFALLITVILIHGIYVGIVRPNADAIIEREAQLQAAGTDYVPQRSIYVVVRDFEQETCFILLIWALTIMGYKARRVVEEHTLLAEKLLQVPEGTSILPEDAREYSRPLEAMDELPYSSTLDQLEKSYYNIWIQVVTESKNGYLGDDKIKKIQASAK